MKILVLEDDKMLQRAYIRMLRRYAEGMDIQVVSCPEEAMGVISDGFRPDIVLSDWDMPGGSGGEFCLAMRGLGYDTPFVIVSGQDHTKDLEWTGATACLHKPLSWVEVRETIKRLVKI